MEFKFTLLILNLSCDVGGFYIINSEANSDNDELNYLIVET